MSYELEIQKSFPIAVNTLNGTRPPLVAGSGSATLLSAASSQPVFDGWVQGRESSQFSIEMWALPLTVTGPKFMMVGRTNDGLRYDGSDYILQFEYVGAGIVEGRWREPEVKAHHFVITYDTESAALYVDGERVINLDLPPNDTFSRTVPNIVLNGTDGSGIYDSLAFYYRVLSDAEIKEHFALGRAVSSSVDIASSKGATTWSLNYADVDVFQTISYDSDNWNLGHLTDVSYTANRLEADVAGGTWQAAIPLGSMISPTTAGVHLRYVGEGVTLEWSTDAVTWTGIENKTTVLEDAGTTDLTLFVRLTLINEDSWVQSFTADLLSSRVMQPFSGTRLIDFGGTEMDHTPGLQLEYQSDMGASIKNGHMDINVDSADAPTGISSVEMWVKINSVGGRLLRGSGTQYAHVESNGTLNISGTSLYRNSVSTGNYTVPLGIWEHLVFLFDTPLTGARIGNTPAMDNPLDVTIGHVAVYERKLTQAEITSIYNSNIGAPGLRVDDVGGFSLSESATPYDIYAYTWSIVGGSN